eukprot:COSAG01_NODE_1429_length_10330_cov_4.369759_10_plen_107_part_00
MASALALEALLGRLADESGGAGLSATVDIGELQDELDAQLAEGDDDDGDPLMRATERLRVTAARTVSAVAQVAGGGAEAFEPFGRAGSLLRWVSSPPRARTWRAGC